MNAQQHEALDATLSELFDIQEQMLEGLERASTLIRETGLEMTWQRANAYWLAHAKMALTNQHSYLGGSMVSMEDSLEEIGKYLQEGAEG